MGYSINETHITAARKRHLCDWCLEAIQPGEPYERWRYVEGGDIGNCKAHLECVEAMNEMAKDYGYPIEFTRGENPRGCICGHDPHCDRCKERKNNATTLSKPPESPSPFV